MIYIGLLLVLIVVIAAIFINTSPQFGGPASDEKIAGYKASPNYKEGIFHNEETISLDMSMSDMGKAMIGYFRTNPKTRPENDIAVLKADSTEISQYQAETRMIWFGHSTFLLQMNKKNILIDPMFGDVPAPHPMLGGKRFSSELPIEVERLPKIDVVVLSHDHYDHLDYESILKLKDKVEIFYVPLGLSGHLLKWGVAPERVIEFDWWDEIELDGLKFVCTPAQHFSGRGISDRTKTLWASWIIQSDTENIFFSGDSGYSKHFKEIGEKYGPFDFAMLECGQYNDKWKAIHMVPEETAQAALDLKAKTMMPIHWGAFKLSEHGWTEPVDRVTKKAKELKVDVKVPRIGEEIIITEHDLPIVRWW
ncbi:MAG: L-ascorbate metabolism protein UlaG (beta-lactamase superfamily) [Patiriisocius sp.]|jgi:L-ascorbate metabolism protein UlaG (beta-lactamase superfamily)